MASGREERNYSSPPKRLKLDDSAILSTSSIEIDKVTVSASFKSTETSPEGKLTENKGNTIFLFGHNMATFKKKWPSPWYFLRLHFGGGADNVILVNVAKAFQFNVLDLAYTNMNIKKSIENVLFISISVL